MRATLSNIYWLGTKELRSFLHDAVLLVFVIYAFSFAVIAMANSVAQELHNASVGIVDQDRSALSRAIGRAFLPPYFLPAEQIDGGDADLLQDRARYTFVIEIPPHFERDVLAGRNPGIRVSADATAAMQAGIGAGYIEAIITAEVARAVTRTDYEPDAPAALQVHISFNPNASSAWFMGLMGIVNNVTMLSIVLAGAAVIREREHGTMDHLLVMPLRPVEIALAKIWANGLTITIAVALSLTLIIRALLHIPIHGSVPLFLAGVALYLFFATAIGILLATIARSMPQLGLIYMLVALPMNVLSGNNTPLESMPVWLQRIMWWSPSTHFVAFAQAILFRGASLPAVWPDFAMTALVGLAVFAAALLRFRGAAAQMTG
jgi:ABC-2 type transport system permease protein